MKYLKIIAGLLLLVQAFHLASLQYSTDSPGRTIDREWLRKVDKSESENAANFEQETDPTNTNNDDFSGTASGFMAAGENVDGEDKSANETSLHLNQTLPPTSQNSTTNQPMLPNTTVSPNATADTTNSSQINATETEKEFINSTLTLKNSTTFPDSSNHTDLQSTTLAPESNTTHNTTTTPGRDKGLTNSTGPANTTTVITTAPPEKNQTSNMSSSTSPAITTTAAPKTSERANKTDKDGTSGDGSDRGVASDSHKNKRHGAWGAVLGTAVAVTCLGLVAYFILKNKNQKGFSHRKLVEEYPSDPVLRLDNSGPLDLNFGGSAYYNPGLQGDNIQMTNFPRRH